MNAQRYSERPAANDHERTIAQAARQLVSEDRARFIYVTSHANGATVWRNPVNDMRIVVQPSKAVRK